MSSSSGPLLPCAAFDSSVRSLAASVPGACGPVFRNHPNPFNPSTEIVFSLYRDAPVTLRICDVHGRCVRTLIHRAMDRGMHSVVWHGADDRGAPVGPGVYLCTLETGLDVRTRKMLLLK